MLNNAGKVQECDARMLHLRSEPWPKIFLFFVSARAMQKRYTWLKYPAKFLLAYLVYNIARFVARLAETVFLCLVSINLVT